MPKPHQARKRFGQNFLHDAFIIEKIIKAINPKNTDQIIEIGPGLGAITAPLLQRVEQLNAIELDYDLIPHLETLEGNLVLHQADVLKVDFAEFTQEKHQLRIVGNLPYNISTPLIFHLLDYATHIKDMHFMLQKEVVQRLAAQAGDKHYGRLSVMVQYFCQVSSLFPVPPHSFKPAPKVESAIVRLQPHTTLPHPAKDWAHFSDIVRLAFGQRRKTLRNNLRSVISVEQLESLGIDPQQRAEQLSLADFVAISHL